jgi:hypothetical protein
MRHEYIAGTQPGFPAPLTDGRDRAGVPGLRQAGNAERVEAPDPRSITIREFFNRNRGGTGRAGLGSSCWIEERGHLLRLHTPKGTELVSDHDDTTTVLETVRTTVDCPETDDGQKGLRAHELASIPFARSTAADVTGKIISRLTGAMLAFSGIAILVWVVWAGASIITGYFFESSAVRTDPAPSTSVRMGTGNSSRLGRRKALTGAGHVRQGRVSNLRLDRHREAHRTHSRQRWSERRRCHPHACWADVLRADGAWWRERHDRLRQWSWRKQATRRGHVKAPLDLRRAVSLAVARPVSDLQLTDRRLSCHAVCHANALPRGMPRGN